MNPKALGALLAILLTAAPTPARAEPEPVQIDGNFGRQFIQGQLADVERALGVNFEHLGVANGGLDVYVYFRTPDHSAASPYVFVGLKGGKIWRIGTQGPNGPLWLGAAYASKLPSRRPLVPNDVASTGGPLPAVQAPPPGAAAPGGPHLMPQNDELGAPARTEGDDDSFTNMIQ